MALDPDLWNDDGTAKKPSQEYMVRLAGNQVFLDFATHEAKALAERGPAIGDVVHFFDGEVCRAAIVMEAEGHTATLRVHIPHQPFEDWEADHEEERETGGSWHWAHTEDR